MKGAPYTNWIAEAARVGRFTIVGICATLIYLVTSFILFHVFRLPTVAASLAAQAIAAVVSYFGHAIYSFRVDSNPPFYIIRFLVILALTFLMNGVVSWLLTKQFGISPQITFATVTVLIPVFNYVGNRLWVFHPGIDRRIQQNSNRAI